MSADPSTDNIAIAFIDPRIAGYQDLVKTCDPNVEIIILDPAKDGVQQIADWLDGRSDIKAIHIISHGAPASLRLGSSELSASTIASYAPQLAAIGAALSADADILLYGCGVASGSQGRKATLSILRGELDRLADPGVRCRTSLGDRPVGPVAIQTTFR